MNEKKWVTAWGNAISIAERKPENYGKDLTLRYPLIMQLDGDAVRFTLDNFCGSEAVVVTSATVAMSCGGSDIQADTIKQVTFSGEKSATIEKDGQVVSDAVKFNIKRGDTIVLTLYFADFTELRSGVLITGQFSGGYFAVGDHTYSAQLPVDMSKKTGWYYFLCGADVLTSAQNRCVICYGDSITAQDWPDYLIKLNLEKGNGRTAFIRKAASGTRILRQYDNITYDSYGLKGRNRFAHEMDVSGADTVIIQHGINDIIHPVGVEVNKFRPWSDLPTAEEMADGLKYYLDYAKKADMKVYFGTLLPIKGWRTYAEFRNDLRNAVNEWIRNENGSDGCIDFDKALCDAEDNAAFADGFDSGDHLHPSKAAYERMAETVPENLYK